MKMKRETEMSEVRTSRRATGNPRVIPSKGKWREHKGGVYRCMVYLTPEERGFSVMAAHLPGVVSQGDTEPQALANIIVAFAGAIAVYKERGMSIPWTKTPLEPKRGATARWVIVQA
jgi:predicted RNase H-like HicB family nuclease